MKTAFAFIFLFLIFSNPELSEVRKLYANAVNSKADGEKLIDLMASVSKDDNKTLVAYKGASLALKGKFSPKKEDKKKYFTEGVKILEQALEKDPKNFEIRLIRISIQENTPKILKYKQNIPEDKAFILSNFSKQNHSLKDFTKLYLKQSKIFSETEKNSLQ